MVFDEAGDRKIIFSSFDPDCATLVRLKQPRYPVFFLTCAGAKVHHQANFRINFSFYVLKNYQLYGEGPKI